MAEKRLTKWQKGWSLLEDGNGDQMGEYLRKKDEENATCDWCSVSFKFSLNGISGIKQHANSKKHIDVADLKKNRNKGQQRLISVSAADDQNNTGIRAGGKKMRRCVLVLAPTKRKLQIFSRTQHYPIRGADFTTNLYIQIVYTIGKFCTLLQKFVHFTILSEQE